MWLNRLVTVVKYLILSLVLLFISILAAVNLPVSQRIITGKANDFFSSKEIPAHVEKITLLIGGRIGLRRPQIISPAGDTILYADQISIAVRITPLLFKTLKIRAATINDATVALSRDSVTGSIDLISLFSPGSRPPDPKPQSGSKWQIEAESVTLNNVRFSYDDERGGVKVWQSVGRLFAKLDRLSLQDKSIDIVEVDLESVSGGVELGNLKIAKETRAEKKPSPWNFTLGEGDLRKIRFVLHQPGKKQRMNFSIERGEISEAGLGLSGHTITVTGIDIQAPVASIFSSDDETNRGKDKEKKTGNGFPGPWNIEGGKIKISKGAFQKGDYSDLAMTSDTASLSQVSELSVLLNDMIVGTKESDVNIDRLSFKLANGFELEKGEIAFHTDSAMTSQLEARLTTSSSSATVSLEAGKDLAAIMNSFMTVPFSLDIEQTDISAADILHFLPEWKGKVSEKTQADFAMGVIMNITGNAEALTIRNLEMSARSGIQLSLEGEITNITDRAAATADIRLSAENITRERLADLLGIAGITFNLPEFEPLAIRGNVRNRLLAPELNLSLDGGLGVVALSGSMNITEKNYDLNLICSGLELGAITGVRDLSLFSGKIDLHGTGFSPASLALDAAVYIDTAGFRGYSYHSVSLKANGKNGSFAYGINSNDPAFKCNLSGDIGYSDSLLRGSISGMFDIDAGRLNLYSDLSGKGSFRAVVSRGKTDLVSSLDVRKLSVTRSGKTADLDSLSLAFQSTDSLLNGQLIADFIRADAHFSRSAADLRKAFSEGHFRAASLVDSVVGNRIPIISVMPEMHITAESDYDPFLGLFVNDSIFSYDRVSLTQTKDSEGIARAEVAADNLYLGKGYLYGPLLTFESNPDRSLLDISADSVRFDSITFSDLTIDIETMVDSATYRLRAEGSDNRLLYDIAGQVSKHGREIRAKSSLPEWVVNGFEWSVSPEDYLVLEPWKRNFTADLHWSSGNRSIDIYGSKHEKIFMELQNVGLNMLLIPGMEAYGSDGMLTGEIGYDGNEGMKLDMDMDIIQVTLNENPVGDFVLKGRFASDTLGNMAGDFKAVLNDTTRLSLNLELGKSTGKRSIRTEFSGIPVAPFETFISNFVSDLHGVLNGSLNIISDDRKQSINGSVEIRETGLRVIPLNARFSLPGDVIRVENNMLIFNQFIILDSLNKRLSLNGNIDLNDPDNIIADLEVTSDRIQVMNTSEKNNPEFYGSVFLNSGLDITGPVRNPNVEGKIVLAEGTVINYRYTENLNVSETEKTVTFASLEQADTVLSEILQGRKAISGLPAVEALIEIDPKSLFNFQITRVFDIGVHIRGGGFLTYSMMPNQATGLSGTYEIREGGTVLKIPGWPRKDFVITPGSFIRWDGKMNDPVMQMETTCKVRGSYYNPVDEKNREINFLVYMSLGGRLEDLEIVFDVRAEDQYLTSVINTMSADMRMQQAINLLIFERIELPNSESSTDYVTKQISQFWESQLNQLTRSAIKGVDVSFGIDTFTGVSDAGGKQSYTSLTYEVKKEMFKDRGTVMVSGRMYENTSAGQSSNNLIENFIFEYSVDSAKTKFLKVYRQQNYEDLLEGEVIKSGVGFIYRKNYDRLRDIWRRKKSKEQGARSKEQGD
jgi:hypothetical protein